MPPSEQTLVELVEQKQTELARSPFLAAVLRALKPFQPEIDDIRFLAVGNFGVDDMSVEYQTALALLLQQHFNAKQITAWDPNFKKRDLRVLSELGIRVLQKDPPSSNTRLWFVPHAPYFLEPDLLNRVGTNIYIGNDLNLARENTMRDDKACEPYRCQARVVPLKVKPKDPYEPAFRNTAIHQYQPKTASDAPP